MVSLSNHPTTQPPNHPATFRAGWARPTREGLFWLVVAALLGWQGWARGVNLVALLACFLLGLWLLNGLWVIGRIRLHRLRARRRIDVPVFAREPFPLTVELTNPSMWVQRGLRLDDPDRAHPHAWVVPRLRKGETIRRHSTLRLNRRGKYVWARLRLATGHPFGLFRRTVRQAAAETTIVYPHLGRVLHGRLRQLLRHTARVTHTSQRPVRSPAAQTDFFGLREYHPGDSPRWIHWRTTARVGELMVREFEEPPVEHLTVLLEAWLPEPAAALEAQWRQVRQANRDLITLLLASGPLPPPEKRRAKEEALARKEEPFRKPLETLERAVSLAATLCWDWVHQGARVALGTADIHGGRVLATTTTQPTVWPLLEALAVAEGGPAPQAAALIRALPDAPLPPGPVVLITTRAGGLADQVAAALRRPVTVLDVTQPVIRELFDWDGG